MFFSNLSTFDTPILCVIDRRSPVTINRLVDRNDFNRFSNLNRNDLRWFDRDDLRRLDSDDFRFNRGNLSREQLLTLRLRCDFRLSDIRGISRF